MDYKVVRTITLYHVMYMYMYMYMFIVHLNVIQALHIKQENTKQTTIIICCFKYIAMGVGIEIALYVYMCRT